MKPITCILSDLGKVVVDYDNDLAVRRLADHSTKTTTFISSVLFSPKHGLYKPFERGELSAADFREAVRLACELDPHLSDKAFDDIYGNVFTPIVEVQDLWARMRVDGITMTAVSNIEGIRWEALRDMGIDDMFDHLILSHDEKLAKPSKELMVRALDVSGAKAEESVFIDDKADNLVPAAELGITIHQYRTFEGLQDFLAENGLEYLIYAN